MDNNWKSIAELREPFNDAYNYRSKEEKEFFNKIFLRTNDLSKCLQSATYYLIGEKGAGKTAYAVYLENNPPAGYRCKVTTMTETQYKRFIELKRQGKLAYSDFANIWRSIILFVVSQMLVEKSKTLLHSFTGKFRRIESAVKKWNKNALNPEIEAAFQAVTDQSLGTSIGSESTGKIDAKVGRKETSNSSVITHPLLTTESTLKEAIDDLKLEDNHILFIDGIDYRPENVSYLDYVECVKGLAEAVWQLNTEFFQRIKDSKGRIKVVLLVRPDVFHTLNLYNSNSRIQDNSVFLDWSTTDREYSDSRLYEASGKYFSSQQSNEILPATAWKKYLPSTPDAGRTFKKILRISFQKPRDVLTIIKILRNLAISSHQGANTQLDGEMIQNARFTKEYSDYLLGSVDIQVSQMKAAARATKAEKRLASLS